ncbi:MAG: GDSL-type esterase/lipase family protein [bacterium]|nr:GDSL-type esterase/lipase family protein [Clostridium sp.]MCM1537679.1 GDSL-type esterase/lipase family protein [bacterium]
MKVRPNSGNMKIMGRTTQVGDILYLGFSASYVEFETVASRVSVTMCTDAAPQEESLLGWFAVYLDGAAQPAVRRALRNPEEEFVIFEEAQARNVKIRLVKMSEAAFGLVGIREFDIVCGCGEQEEAKQRSDGQGSVKQRNAGNGNDIYVTKTPNRPHRMEVIGDSITCGYGNEGVLDKDTFTTAQENPEEAYAVLTANALDADYQLVSWSGIGVITNWIPEDVNEPLEEILMPDLYSYRDKRLCEKLGLPLEKWDSAEYQPELIVLHLGTNDDSYVRKIPERQAYFAGRYYAFLEQIHEQNPQAAILCALGVMGQNLCEEEERQTRRFAQEHPGVRIGYLVLPEQDAADGIATDSHPSKRTHKKVAAVLTEKIRAFMGW